MKRGNNTSCCKDENTFKHVAEEWLEIQKPQLKASSIAKYNNIMDLYLTPRFGSISITDISRADIQKFSSDLLTVGGIKSKGLSPKTVNCTLSVLKNILRYASREKSIRVTDMADMTVKQPQKPLLILSRIEQEKLSRYLYEHMTPCNLGIMICLYTGLRIGEICALKWEDIFIPEQYIYVRKTMLRIQTPDGKQKTRVIIQAPKSDCSIRKIPLPDSIISMLKSSKGDPNAFILTGSSYKYIEPRCMENRFKTVIKNCGINDIKFHTLRHTFATRCIELGFDLKSLSEILGHANISITLNRYVHPSMELKQKNMNLLTCLVPSE